MSMSDPLVIPSACAICAGMATMTGTEAGPTMAGSLRCFSSAIVDRRRVVQGVEPTPDGDVVAHVAQTLDPGAVALAQRFELEVVFRAGHQGVEHPTVRVAVGHAWCVDELILFH